MKILAVITSLGSGGAEGMLFKIFSNAERLSFSAHVVSLRELGVTGDHLLAHGIPVTCLHMRPGRVNVFKLLRLFAVLRREQPDVVHTWMYHADLMGGLAARLAGVKAIGWNIRHSNLDPALNKRLTLWIIKLCALLSRWLPRRVMVCSEAARRVHVAAGYAAEKMTLVPNGFDVERFRPDVGARASVRNELGLAPDALLVGMVGRFDPQKNAEGFVEVVNRLVTGFTGVRFVMVGTGLDAENASLSGLVTPEAAGRLHRLGRRDDIPRLMASLDVLVSPSHGEAFPNVLGEAMACGVPCAVTDTGDSAEIVGDTGRVVSVGDMAALAEAVGSLLRLSFDSRRELGARARRRIQERYEIRKIVRQYEDFWRSLTVER